MAHYLVTGGYGFIGSRLTETLINDGHTVRVVDSLAYASADAAAWADNEQLEFIEASTADTDAMEQAFDGVDACFHLAGAPTDHDPRRDGVGHGVKIGEYAKTLFASAHRAGNVPVIYASSAAVYGAQPPGPIAETADTHPVNAHGEEKLLLETAAKEACEAFSVPSVGLRFFNLYGPTQSLESIYCGAPRRFVEYIRTGQAFPLYGGGRQVRDFTYIDDAIASMTNVATSNSTGTLDNGAHVFNICTGVGTTIRELGEMIGHAAGREIVFQDKPLGSTEVETSVGDPTRAQKVLGLKTQIPLYEGIAKMVAHLL
ncbi:NAD-dependent epimerase/dehydratase family protein [Pseudomonadota bacterium]